jgi:hypothetical protein
MYDRASSFSRVQQLRTSHDDDDDSSLQPYTTRRRRELDAGDGADDVNSRRVRRRVDDPVAPPLSTSTVLAPHTATVASASLQSLSPAAELAAAAARQVAAPTLPLTTPASGAGVDSERSALRDSVRLVR